MSGSTIKTLWVARDKGLRLQEDTLVTTDEPNRVNGSNGLYLFYVPKCDKHVVASINFKMASRLGLLRCVVKRGQCKEFPVKEVFGRGEDERCRRETGQAQAQEP